MTGFKLTYAPHRNDHMAAATDEEGELLVNFFKTNQSVKEGRIGMVVEDEGGAHQHIHAYWEVPAKTTAQKMETAMRAQKAGLVGKLRMEGDSWKLETMAQSQTFYMSYGGYCRKHKHRVLYEHDVTEEDKDLGAVQWGCLRKAQAIKLTENSIMDVCLAYREQHGIESTEFNSTLFHMIHNGFSYGYFVVKKGKCLRPHFNTSERQPRVSRQRKSWQLWSTQGRSMNGFTERRTPTQFYKTLVGIVRVFLLVRPAVFLD